jgi:transcriptional regulator with XRE-family HTH domain
MANDSGSRKGLLAAKLDRLFDLVRRDDGTQYTPKDVAEAINEAAGETVISSTYVWQLRVGRRGNPTYRHLIALSQFFVVPPSYFFDDEAPGQATQSAEVEAALRDDVIRDIALRAVGLSPAP